MRRSICYRALLLACWAILAAGCSDDDQGGAPRAIVPTTETIYGWIEEVFEQGVRRPGYPADDWAIEWTRDHFVAMGLEQVTLHPIDVERWQPLSWSLEVWHPDTPADVVTIPSYAMPFSADVEALDGELVLATEDETTELDGAIAVVENQIIDLPQLATRAFATWEYDPSGELQTHVQTLPFSASFNQPMEPYVEAGAIGFIGILRGFPWDTDRYYVPYDAEERPIPGLWLSSSNGDRLLQIIEQGPTRGRIVLRRELETVRSYNVTGVLPGAGDDWVIIGSHHDGPWASAVEDASGIALVLAQAQYWASVPREQRPHNLMFLLNGGHMAGGAGLRSFVANNRDLIAEDVVVEIHLEHAAREARGVDGELVPTDAPEVRWWFTSFIPDLEQAVADTICRRDLIRSFIMPPEGFPPGSSNPPTDAAFFHPLSPIVSFLTAPMYLFDEQDTLDKIHQPSLVPLTLATIDIVEALRDQTAASLRAQIYQPPRATPLDCTPEEDPQ